MRRWALLAWVFAAALPASGETDRYAPDSVPSIGQAWRARAASRILLRKTARRLAKDAALAERLSEPQMYSILKDVPATAGVIGESAAGPFGTTKMIPPEFGRDIGFRLKQDHWMVFFDNGVVIKNEGGHYTSRDFCDDPSSRIVNYKDFGLPDGSVFDAKKRCKFDYAQLNALRRVALPAIDVN